PATCAACGAPLGGPFCAACGQRVLDGRHTLRRLVGDAFQRLFNVEGGLTHTFLQMTVNPARVVRDYLSGRTVVYTHPVAYLIIAFAIFALAFSWLGGTSSAGIERLAAGAIPLFLAFASRLVFLRTGLNYAEHLILNMFLFAHGVLFLTLAMVVPSMLPQTARTGVLAGALAVVCAYVVWSYSRIFPQRAVLAAVGGLCALVLGLGLWAGALALVIARVAATR